MTRSKEINQAIEVLGQIEVQMGWFRNPQTGEVSFESPGVAREQGFTLGPFSTREEAVLGRDGTGAHCQCALDTVGAYQALVNIVNAATVGGLGVETFDKFPDWIRRHKEDFGEDLENLQESCGVDIGPGSPLTPIIFHLDGLDAFAEAHGRFETQIRATQMLEMLFTALQECR